MRKFLPLFLILAFLSGCVSSEKLLQQGNYRQAIDRAFKKVGSNPKDTKQIAVLKKALKLANQQDLDAIKQLQLDGNRASTPQIYQHYLLLDQRQQKIHRLPDNILHKINFKHIDYNLVLAESKKAAADYYHGEASRLLATNEMYNARKAYYFLKDEQKLYPNTPGIDELLSRALDAGTVHILFEVDNASGQDLPQAFTDELYRINPGSISQNWTQLDSYPVKNRFYQYLAKLNISMINIGPQQINRRSFEEQKKIPDGWNYVLDKRGNVKKDSLGNDIKVPKFKIIRCRVTEVVQMQASNVQGTIGIYNNASGRPLQVQNIQSQFVFRYRYGMARGNRNALDKRTLDLISREPVPFPDYVHILYENGKILQGKTEYFLRSNRNIFK